MYSKVKYVRSASVPEIPIKLHGEDYEYQRKSKLFGFTGNRANSVTIRPSKERYYGSYLGTFSRKISTKFFLKFRENVPSHI